jgi:hypothetical protein
MMFYLHHIICGDLRIRPHSVYHSFVLGIKMVISIFLYFMRKNIAQGKKMDEIGFRKWTFLWHDLIN